MKHGLFIVAHAGAVETLREFWPHWKRLGVPLVAFLPEGDTWPIEERPDTLIIADQSAHKGPLAFQRLLNVFGYVGRLGFDAATVIEPDCLAMRPELPILREGQLSGWACKFDGGAETFEHCLLPPWTATVRTFDILARRCAESAKQSHTDCGDFTDRWLFKSALRAGVGIAHAWETFGYTPTGNSHEWIAESKPSWVHGWKRKSDFRELWPA